MRSYLVLPVRFFSKERLFPRTNFPFAIDGCFLILCSRAVTYFGFEIPGGGDRLERQSANLFRDSEVPPDFFNVAWMLEQGSRSVVFEALVLFLTHEKTQSMSRCLLALGANLGDRAATFHQAVLLSAALPRTQLLARSTWHETTPVGGPVGQPGFLNGSLLLETSLEPTELARHLREIETQLGRERHSRWCARTIDIDVLLLGAQNIDTDELQIPHPRMSFRQFVLSPANEIAGDMIHPTSRWTISALLNHWQTVPRTISIFGKDRELSHWLSEKLSQELAGEASDHAGTNAIKLVAPSEQPALIIALDEPAQIPGPLARITSSDRAIILEEAISAIQAAWPDC